MSVRSGLPTSPQSEGGNVVNLYRQHAQSTGVQYRPESISELVSAVADVRRQSSKARAGGSYYSLSAAAMPGGSAIQTRRHLDKHLAVPLAPNGNQLDADRYRSTAFEAVKLDWLVSDEWLALNGESALVYCEAGIQLRQLIGDLTQVGLALPTMGSGSTQTLAGAVSTGTHGSDWLEPPLGDYIEAIHLVVDGGQEWWIEGTNGLCDGPALRSLPHWHQGTRIVRDDEVLAAAQVAAGRFGVWYSVILKAIPQYGLERRTFDVDWESFKAQLSTSVTDGYDAPGALLEDPAIRAFEAIYEPNSQVVRITTRRLRPDIVEPSGESFNSSSEFFLELLCNPVHASLGIGSTLHGVSAILDGIAALKSAIPFAGPFLAVPYFAAATKLRVLAVEVHTGSVTGSELITRIIRIFRDDGLPELRGHVAEVLGSALLDEERKLGTRTGLSYEMMDSASGSAIDEPVDRNGPDLPCILVDSAEVFFDARSARLVPYLDAMADRFRGQRPTEAFFSMRLSGRSRALIGMEKWAPTMAVEVAALQPYKSAEILEAARTGVEAGGILHWGQMQPDSYDAATVQRLFGDDLTAWRRALAYVEATRRDSTFSTRHSIDRGLEWEDFSSAIPPRGRYNEEPLMFETALFEPMM